MSSIDMPQAPEGYLDIGGAAISRTELAKVLPDIERFETNLTDALAVDSHLKNADGAVPDYVKQWTEERLSDVIITLKELGSIREQLLRQQGEGSSAGDDAS